MDWYGSQGTVDLLEAAGLAAGGRSGGGPRLATAPQPGHRTSWGAAQGTLNFHQIALFPRSPPGMHCPGARLRQPTLFRPEVNVSLRERRGVEEEVAVVVGWGVGAEEWVAARWCSLSCAAGLVLLPRGQQLPAQLLAVHGHEGHLRGSRGAGQARSSAAGGAASQLHNPGSRPAAAAARTTKLAHSQCCQAAPQAPKKPAAQRSMRGALPANPASCRPAHLLVLLVDLVQHRPDGGAHRLLRRRAVPPRLAPLLVPAQVEGPAGAAQGGVRVWV